MQVPEPFDLDLTVRSHGFYDLPPWRYDRERRVLSRPLRLEAISLSPRERVGVRGDAAAVFVEVAEANPHSLALRVVAGGPLPSALAASARDAVRRCLGLDEDLSPFHAAIAELAAHPPPGRAGAGLPSLRWAVERGAGRLLRSPTVFEDAVKTLCTTNCSWALTRTMTSKLVERLGVAAPLGTRCFPTPEAMAAQPERFYREEIRAGYRAPCLRSLAAKVARGEVDAEGWRSSPLDTGALAAQIAALDGFGPYATQHLLRLLGRYDHLALDSWTRAKLGRLRGRRQIPTDRAIARWYAPFGRFAGLAMWLEVTADWHGAEPSWP